MGIPEAGSHEGSARATHESLARHRHRHRSQGRVVPSRRWRPRPLGCDQSARRVRRDVLPGLDEARRSARCVEEPRVRRESRVNALQTTFVTSGSTSRSRSHAPLRRRGSLRRHDRLREGPARDPPADKLATLGEVAIGLAHEISNPLAVIVNQAALAPGAKSERSRTATARSRTSASTRSAEKVARISEIVERLGEMVATERYETIHYVGPARMVDLRNRERRRHAPDPRLRDTGSSWRTTIQYQADARGCSADNVRSRSRRRAGLAMLASHDQRPSFGARYDTSFG